MRILIFSVVLVGAAGAVIWLAGDSARIPDQDQVLKVDALDWYPTLKTDAAGGGVRPSTEPVAQTLPHFWPTNADREQRYSLSLPLKVPPNRLWALYLPNVRDDVMLRVNGSELRVFDKDVYGARAGLRSIYVPIPNGVIAEGYNRFELVVRSSGVQRGLLDAIYLGPASTLGPVHQNRLQEHRLFWYSNLALVLLAIVGAVLARGSRDDRIYGWFAVMCVLWAGHLSATVMVHSPVPWEVTATIQTLLRLAFTAVACLFCMDYIGAATGRVQQYFWGLCALCMIAVLFTAVLAPAQTDQLYPLFLAPMQLSAVYVGYRFLRVALTGQDEDIISLSVAGVLILCFGVHASYVIWRSEAVPLPYINYLTPLLALIIGYVLIHRFTRALREAEALAVSLNRNTPANAGLTSSALLDASKLRQELLLQERERIMRDMHDGVGGHLVSSLSILRNRDDRDEALEEVLNQALVDLRLMIDSLDDSDGDLSGAIAMLKERTARTLQSSGIQAHWRIDEVQLPGFGPADTLQVLRILQEALTNTLKHAQAETVWISATMDGPDQACFTVRDDGLGLPDDRERLRSSRGLGNMTRRAEQLGGTLTFGPAVTDGSPPGTELKLRVPAPEASI